MNTCQTSIKTDTVYYYSVAEAPMLGLRDKHEITTLVPSELKKRGYSSQVDKYWPLEYVSYDETTETIIASYWPK